MVLSMCLAILESWEEIITTLIENTFAEYHVVIIDILHRNYNNENYKNHGYQISSGDTFSPLSRQAYKFSLIVLITNLRPVEHKKKLLKNF